MSDPHRAGHESADATLLPITLIAVAVAALVGVALVLGDVFVAGLTRRALATERAVPGPRWPAPSPPGPRLQAHPARDLRAYRAAQRERMSRYQWMDRAAGRVRVPVERALELVVRDGLPVRKAQEEEER